MQISSIQFNLLFEKNKAFVNRCIINNPVAQKCNLLLHKSSTARLKRLMVYSKHHGTEQLLRQYVNDTEIVCS